MYKGISDVNNAWKTTNFDPISHDLEQATIATLKGKLKQSAKEQQKIGVT